MTNRGFFSLRDALRALRDTLPQLRAQVAGDPEAFSAASWYGKLVRNVLPALDFDLPVLLVAICGGGSTGKSTLFNTLAGATLSGVGFRAGLTQRVVLVGHPDVLSSEGAVRALLHRLPEAPLPWSGAADALVPGPPIYATVASMPRNLLLLDTPDFDTGEGARMLNRERAEPILRTAEVILYVFTNAVYNNLSNLRFVADIVGGIGGRPTILVYRISRAASESEVLEHCAVVAHKLYQGQEDTPFPPAVCGIYRLHESDAVAMGEGSPRFIPVGEVTRGRELTKLLADLDVAAIKRHVFAADLRQISVGAAEELVRARGEAQAIALYRQTLDHAMAEQALQALQTFPANEALGLVMRFYVDGSPSYVRLLRNTGRLVAAPLRAVQKLGQAVNRWAGGEGIAPPPDPEARLIQDLLLAANALRNRLLNDRLILRVAAGHPLLAAVAQAQQEGWLTGAGVLEPLGQAAFNLHVPVPRIVAQQASAVRDQPWDKTVEELRRVAHDLLGMPTDIEQELRTLVAEFRASMSWQQRLREVFLASLTALPPLLGVTYALLTADPVSGTGLWIKLQSVLGINDLWALVSIPASAGLSERERKLLQQTISPVFRLWLERRMGMVVSVFARTICAHVLRALQGAPTPMDSRFGVLEAGLRAIKEAS